MKVHLDPSSVADYQKFLKIKQLPSYTIHGREASFPDEYASMIGGERVESLDVEYTPRDGMFDYQVGIVRLAIQKRRFAVFADCGLGKTFIFLEYARHALASLGGRNVLIVSPLMVMEQTVGECRKFYGDGMEVRTIHAAGLQEWLSTANGEIGITNYEAIREGLDRGNLGALILDESSLLKSHYGKWGTRLIEMGAGLEWKLCCTGTPAPNDRIEYANHAVFLDAFPTVNSFLARFFVNRGQTSERWALKKHALQPFYRALSHWAIFLSNPTTYGWEDIDTSTIPPIHIHKHHVDMTAEQIKLTMNQTGSLFAHKIGGIANRASLASIAKGWYHGKPVDTYKPTAIRELVEQWPDESTIIWCLYNEEQRIMEREFPHAASLKGSTPHPERMKAIEEFKAGTRKVLISKPKILGFGLNLQIATRQVFSGLQDSYESFYQAVKRSNRIGSTRPLHVHIPMTDIEAPMIDNVLRKADMVQKDTEEQERMFRDSNHVQRSEHG